MRVPTRICLRDRICTPSGTKCLRQKRFKVFWPRCVPSPYLRPSSAMRKGAFVRGMPFPQRSEHVLVNGETAHSRRMQAYRSGRATAARTSRLWNITPKPTSSNSGYCGRNPFLNTPGFHPGLTCNARKHSAGFLHRNRHTASIVNLLWDSLSRSPTRKASLKRGRPSFHSRCLSLLRLEFVIRVPHLL